MLLRALNTKGNTPADVQASFSPGLTIDDFTLPEYHFLRRMIRFSHSSDVTAVAAQFGHIVFGSNNPGQRTLCVLEKMIIVNTSAATLAFRYGMHLKTLGVSPTGPTSPGPLDDRSFRPDGTNIPFSAFSASQFSNAAQQLPTTDFPQVVLPTNTFFVVDNIGAILTSRVVSGGEIHWYVQAGTVNTGYSASFYWRERAILPSEL